MKQRLKKAVLILGFLPMFALFSNCAGGSFEPQATEGTQQLPSTGQDDGNGSTGATPTPTPTPTPSPTVTPPVGGTPTPTPTATPRPSVTPTPTPVMTPTPTPTPMPTMTPTPTPTPVPTVSPTPTPSNPSNPNGRWVLSGYGGRHMTSADGGKTWTNDFSDIANGGDDKYLQRAAAFFKGAFITVGWRIQRSTDGAVFQSSEFLKQWFGGAVVGNGRLVAVGGCGNRAYSNDGINWTDVPNNACSDHLRGVVYGNGIFFAYGTNGARMTSPDGLTWTTHPNYVVTGVAYGLGYFWGVNSTTKVVRSLDGITWSDVTVAGATGFNGFNFVNNFILLTTSTKNYRTLDGSTWSAFGSGMSGRIFYGGGSYIGLSWQTVYRSTDGMTWTQTSKGGNSFEAAVWAP